MPLFIFGTLQLPDVESDSNTELFVELVSLKDGSIVEETTGQLFVENHIWNAIASEERPLLQTGNILTCNISVAAG
jgi:hypothetical protein